MDITIKVTLWIHIVSGFLAFLVAPCALATKKGGKAHRTWGKIFFWAMAIATLAAAVISLYRPILFLFMIAIFSFYLAFTGYRILYRKKANEPPRAIDWIVSGIMLATGLGLVFMGLFAPPAPGFGAVCIVFGLVSILFSSLEIRKFVKPPDDKHHWVYQHIANMMGAYISAVSAFSAVNFLFLPPVIRWLWPTLVGVPSLLLMIGHYKKRLESSGKLG